MRTDKNVQASCHSYTSSTADPDILINIYHGLKVLRQLNIPLIIPATCTLFLIYHTILQQVSVS